MEANRSVLTVRDLTIDLRKPEGITRLINGVSLELQPGSVLGIVGESGSGKSITCLACMGLLPPNVMISRGNIAFLGRELTMLAKEEWRSLRRSRLSMIVQNPMAAFNPIRRISDHFVETLRGQGNIGREEAWELAIASLEQLNLPRPALLMKQFPFQLSGGMLQRVMIAIAMAARPDVLIADEPTTALDTGSQLLVLRELGELCRNAGTALIIVTHDLDVIAELADDVAVMHQGEIVEKASVHQLFNNPVHPYAHILVNTRIC